MKAILVSKPPKIVAGVLKGKISYLIFKKFPKNYRGWVYFYCPKRKPYLFDSKFEGGYHLPECSPLLLEKAITYIKALSRYGKESYKSSILVYGTPYGNVGEYRTYFNGQVVARFYCDNVEEFELKLIKGGLYFSKSGAIDFPNEDAQLDNFELLDYAGEKLGTRIYAIPISQLEIFDKPKELNKFKYYKKFSEVDYMLPIPRKETCERLVTLTRAPQNVCYVEVEE